MGRLMLAGTLAIVSVAIAWGDVMAAGSSGRHHVAVDILADKTAAVPGKTLTVAVREKIEQGWHTYWVNPGDSGEPTAIEWVLPGGFTAGPIQWPLPHKIAIGPLANYGYEGEVFLLTDIQLPNEIGESSITLAAKVSYLVCKDICIPEETNVTLTLPVASSATPSQEAQAIESVRKTLPVPLSGTASYAVNSAKGALRLTISADQELFQGIAEAHFFPITWGPVSNSAPQPMKIEGGSLTLDLKQGDTKETPDKLDGVLVLRKAGAEGARMGYTISAARGPDSGAAGGLFDHADASGAASGPEQRGTFKSYSGALGIAVFFAFLGGVVLNFMPCVFPVLAVKTLSFADAANGSHRRQGYAYLSGVLASFGLIGAIIAGFREGSSALGWGFQFQSPPFVLALALLFFVMGLSLSGTVYFGSGLMSTGDRLSRKPGNAGYFFTGVLAAIAATPCTAPFMGAAVGYAVTRPLLELMAVMLGLGLGFAAPVFLLSVSPAMQRFLPKPGRWMETLKQVLAFPLYATAAWLVWILSIQAGSDGVMAAALSFVGVGFAAWLANKTALLSLPAKLVAPALGIIALAIGLSMTAAENGQVSSEAGASLLKEEPFTQARLDELKAAGRPVFVNLTAAWCITCKVNEQVALRSNAVANAFRSAGITYLKGDWTKPNPEIGALLEQFGRAGVPLYVFYPANGGKPRVLPQLLTAGLVLDQIKPQSATSEGNPRRGA
ncbi:MAG TPA: protein-disulfide reductase DsbD domain-containing protein [Hyphomicrobiales bacterium]|nr:protein-disulfide reductase DsbD domain-containing protein [Hyphomicrobiales bacterium]